MRALCILLSLAGAAAATDWRADLQLLGDQLPRLHKHLFHSLPEKDFHAAVERLAAAAGSRPGDETIVGLMRLLARVGDGHTQLEWWRLPFRRHPIEVRWFSDGPFVVAAGGCLRRSVGARLESVGGRSARELLCSLAGLVSHDNDSCLRVQAPHFLRMAELLHALGAAQTKETALWVFRDRSGGRVEIESAAPSSWKDLKWARPKRAVPLCERNAGSDFWNDWLEESKTLYFKYDRCRDLPRFSKLVKGTFNFVDTRPVERFVLDLRDNGGGSSLVFLPLLHAIQTRPKVNRRGSLFVLIGGGTQSSAVLNAIQLRKTNAILVGTPTGTRPNHYGEVKTLVLPSSGLRVRYSTAHFRWLTDRDPDALEPDVPVDTDSAAWLAGRDPVLEAALAYEPTERPS
jgi:hypothetical protein